MDGTENTQGVSSEEDTGTSTEPRTWTEDEHKAEVVKARSDALAEVGRLKKAADNAVEAVRKSNKRIEQLQRTQDEAELEIHKDEPEALSAIRERQKRRDAETELADTKQELDDKTEKLKLLDEKEVEYTKERNAREIATRLGVDQKILGELAKLTDGSVEAIEGKAKLLPKKGEPSPTLKVDSAGKTTGGTKTYKSEEMLKTLDPSKMTPQQISEQVKELVSAGKEGRIK